MLRQDQSVALVARYGRVLVVDAIRETLDARRSTLRDADAAHEADMGQRLAQGASRLASRSAPSLRRVFNPTGTGLRCGSLTPKTAR